MVEGGRQIHCTNLKHQFKNRFLAQVEIPAFSLPEWIDRWYVGDDFFAYTILGRCAISTTINRVKYESSNARRLTPIRSSFFYDSFDSISQVPSTYYISMTYQYVSVSVYSRTQARFSFKCCRRIASLLSVLSNVDEPSMTAKCHNIDWNVMTQCGPESQRTVKKKISLVIEILHKTEDVGGENASMENWKFMVFCLGNHLVNHDTECHSWANTHTHTLKRYKT